MTLTKPCFTQRGLWIFALSIGIIFFLSACSDDSDPSVIEEIPSNDASAPGLLVTGLDIESADSTTSPWLASVSFFRFDFEATGGGDASVNLLQYNDEFPVSRHVEFYTPTLDTCEIRNNDGGGGDGGNRPLGVSGGTSVTINSPSGTFAEINRRDGTEGFYESVQGLPGALPVGATLSIPGDVFPNVPAYVLNEASAPVRIAPVAGTLTLEQVTQPFTWEAMPGIPGGYFQLVALAFDSNGDFQGFPVICDVVDDGSFNLPADVIEEFENSTFEIQTRFSRVIARVDFVDNIVFYQRSIVSD